MKKLILCFILFLFSCTTAQPTEPSNENELNENNEIADEPIEEPETNIERLKREYDLIEINEYDEIIYSSELYLPLKGK